MEVEQGIPIPKKRSGRPGNGFPEIIKNLNIGDSVLATRSSDKRNCYKYALKAGIKVTTRTHKDGCRIWRIE